MGLKMDSSRLGPPWSPPVGLGGLLDARKVSGATKMGTKGYQKEPNWIQKGFKGVRFSLGPN